MKNETTGNNEHPDLIAAAAQQPAQARKNKKPESDLKAAVRAVRTDGFVDEDDEPTLNIVTPEDGARSVC